MYLLIKIDLNKIDLDKIDFNKIGLNKIDLNIIDIKKKFVCPILLILFSIFLLNVIAS